MDISQLSRLPMIDCHTHFGGPDLEAVDVLLEKEAAGGCHQVALLMSSFPSRVNGNPEGLFAKTRHPQRVYLFAGLDYSAVLRDVSHRWTLSLARQVDRLAQMGCDGIKMLNGKPNYRKASGLALDSAVYDDYFARLAETGFPVLWHVNDPEEFWRPQEAPEWARAPGWLYDETFPSSESIYQECERVLERHPQLKLILAHFYFLSADLPRAAALFDRYPNLHFDLAPGIEMLHNFSKRPEEAREFFLKYQRRLVYGTDFSPKGLPSRIWVVRNFLETDEVFHVPTDDRLFWPDHRTMIKGIALPEEALRSIYADNFRRLTSDQPRPLDRDLVVEEVHRIAALCDALGASPNPARGVAAHLLQEPEAGGESADLYRHLVL